MMNSMKSILISLLWLVLIPGVAHAQFTPDETGDFPTMPEEEEETPPAVEEEPAPAVEEEPAPAVEEEPAPAEPAAVEEPESDSSSMTMEADVVLSAEASPSAEEGNTWNLSVAPRLGVAIPTSRLSPFVSMGVELGYRLPILSGHLVAVGDLAYTRPSRSSSVNDSRVGGDADFTIKETEIKFGAGAAYRLFDDTHALNPWAGGSLIMQRLKSAESNNLAPGENTSSDTRLGAELAFGADYRIGPGYVLGEARIPLTDLDDLITGNSNAGNVNLSAGYRFVF
jgi:hypothetical protein